MKRKFVILTLCFTIIFSSLNYKKTYADGGVISLPILATVSALAVGTGIVINNNDDIYDLGKMFYDYVDKHNEMTWQSIQAFFLSSVSLVGNKVSVDSKFLDIVKDFFNNAFTDPTDKYVSGVPTYPVYAPVVAGKDYGDFYINEKYEVYLKMNLDLYPHEYRRVKTLSEHCNGISFSFEEDIPSLHWLYRDTPYSTSIDTDKSLLSPGNVFTYNGGYSWDNVENKKENNKVALPIPGNLGNLVGQGSSDFWDNTDNLVGSGDISIPNVSDPSISLDGTTSFPNTNVDTGNPSIPDTGNPSIPNNGLDIFPPWGGGIDFTPVTQSSFIDKFPFSLGNDIKNILNIFDVEPVAPRFKVPIVSETIELDLTEFEQLASIVRFFILVGFIISLILITRSVIG